MKKNEIKVKDILGLMSDKAKVDCSFYAYGIKACDTWEDGFRTVDDVLENVRGDLLNAQVIDIHSGIDQQEEDILSKAVTIICATLTKEA